MPRAGWTKPVSERRLSDLVSVGVLTRTFPPGLVDEVIAETGRKEQRHRSLPARTMAYFAIGMALHSEGSYEDVLGLMSDVRGPKQDRAASVMIRGHAFIQNLRRGHYELGADARPGRTLAAALDELALVV